MHNLVIEIDDGADEATGRSSYTVLEGVDPGDPVGSCSSAATRTATTAVPTAGTSPTGSSTSTSRPTRRAISHDRRRGSSLVKFGFAVPAYGTAVDAGIAELARRGRGARLRLGLVARPHRGARVRDGGEPADPLPRTLAACAWGLGRTSRLRFGTDVLVAPYRHPLAVAAMVGTMGQLAGDRLVLGVGIGYLRGEFEVLGADYDARAATTEEWVRDAARTARRVLGRAGAVTGSGVDRRQQPARRIDGLRCSATAGTRCGCRPRSTPPRVREILDIRREAGLDVPFTFSFSAGPTRFSDVPAGGWPPARRARPRDRSSVTRPSSGWRPTADRAWSVRPTT